MSVTLQKFVISIDLHDDHGKKSHGWRGGRGLRLPRSVSLCILLQLPLPFANQPKALVGSEVCLLIITTNFLVNRTARRLVGEYMDVLLEGEA
jgi:hypothetical protein